MKKLLFLLVVLGAMSGAAFGQRVQTLVPSPTFAGDALSVDRHGNIYASDFAGPNGDGRGTVVRKITRSGEISVFAVGFDGPAGSAFDREGNLFVANFNSGVISKVTPDGNVSVFASGLNGPVGVAIDEQDNIYVSNAGIGFNPGYIINKITKNRAISVFVDFALVDPAFLALGGLTRDRHGNFYVTNFINGKIKKITPNGAASDFAVIPGNISFETGSLGYLTYNNEDLFVTYIGGNQIFRITLNGAVSVFAGTGEAGNQDGQSGEAQFNGPNGIVANRLGNFLYVSEINNRSLRRISGVRGNSN